MIDRSKAVSASKSNAYAPDCEHQHWKNIDHPIRNQAQLKICNEVYDENGYPLRNYDVHQLQMPIFESIRVVKQQQQQYRIDSKQYLFPHAKV